MVSSSIVFFNNFFLHLSFLPPFRVVGGFSFAGDRKSNVSARLFAFLRVSIFLFLACRERLYTRRAADGKFGV